MQFTPVYSSSIQWSVYSTNVLRLCEYGCMSRPSLRGKPQVLHCLKVMSLICLSLFAVVIGIISGITANDLPLHAPTPKEVLNPKRVLKMLSVQLQSAEYTVTLCPIIELLQSCYTSFFTSLWCFNQNFLTKKEKKRNWVQVLPKPLSGAYPYWYKRCGPLVSFKHTIRKQKQN